MSCGAARVVRDRRGNPDDFARVIRRLVGFAVASPGSLAKAVRRATGSERFHVHQIRHTFACPWLERGGSLAALQQILGHASIVTTQRYAKVTDEVVMWEAARIGGR